MACVGDRNGNGSGEEAYARPLLPRRVVELSILPTTETIVASLPAVSPIIPHPHARLPLRPPLTIVVSPDHPLHANTTLLLRGSPPRRHMGARLASHLAV